VPSRHWLFITQNFEQLALAPKNRVAPNLFTVLKHYLSFRIFEQLALALKTEFALIFFTVLDILFTCRILSNLCLPWKTECALNSCIQYIFLSFRISNNLRLSWKTEFALKFLTILIIFSNIHGNIEQLCACPEKYSLLLLLCIEGIFCNTHHFLSNLACPEKQSLPWNFSLHWNFFIFQDFWATCACPENRVCTENFHCMEWIYSLHSGFLSNLHLPWNTEFALNSLYWRYIFIFQDFWATCTCPENRVCPDFTVLNLYYLLFRILSNLLLPWKTKIFLYWNIFHLARFLSDLRLPWKQNLPWFFQTRGAAAPPPPLVKWEQALLFTRAVFPNPRPQVLGHRRLL